MKDVHEVLWYADHLPAEEIRELQSMDWGVIVPPDALFMIRDRPHLNNWIFLTDIREYIGDESDEDSDDNDKNK